MAMAEHAAPGHGDSHHEAAHATNQTYVRIAVILAVITLAEVAIYYLPSARGLLVPALLVLSIAKFVMVVGFFMHLKYDNRLFRAMFAAGLVVTLAVYLAFLAMAWTNHYWVPSLPV